MSDFDPFDTQRRFINAAAEHLGVPLDRLMEDSHVTGGASCKHPMTVAFVVYLEPKDLPAIAERMKRNADRESADALNTFLGGKPRRTIVDEVKKDLQAQGFEVYPPPKN